MSKLWGSLHTTIGAQAFLYCRSLVSVTIPSGVTSINDTTFGYCLSLKNVSLPDTLTVIESFAFSYCYELEEIKIPESVEYIDNEVFTDCKKLKEITIPKNVSSINYGIVQGCSSLTKISVDKDNSVYHSEGNCIIETARKSVVAGCNASVIPYGIEEISWAAFKDCDGLKKIVIPSTVTTLDFQAFFGCKPEQIIMPDSIKIIDYNVFSFWTSEWENPCINIYYAGSEEQWNSIDIPNDGKMWLKYTTITYDCLLPKGDVNADFSTDNLDATVVLKYDAGIKEFIDTENADYNGDGVIDNLDAALILKYDAGL